MSIAIDQTTRTKISQLLNALCQGLYEREEAVKLALLSAIAGESIFLLGPPGVGKSLIARRLKFAFKDGTSFEYLMSKFSTPDEIFGPVSIKKLKEEDKYERLTDRYLPSANIVFLDEIWKAGPAIQNALLTILNEKIYRNGNEDVAVDIRGIITASNELPPKNHSLDPIWDRFLIRLELSNIRQFRQFLDMIVDTGDVYADDIPEALKLTVAELEDWSKKIDAITVPPEVLNTIQVVKVKLDQHNSKPNHADDPILVYDRRWKKVVRLMRTAAFLNGRSKVDLMDCFLMLHCLWSKPAQRETIREMVTESIRKHGYTLAVNLKMIRNEVEDFEQDVEQETKVKYTVTEEQLMPVEDTYFALEKEEEQFEGALVPIKQFNQLSIEKEQVTNFYDANFKLVNRLKARKGKDEHSIEVFFNSNWYTYALRTNKLEKTKTVFKKPHPVVVKYWEERHHKLMHYMEQQEQKFGTETPEELAYLEENLFVDSELSAIVKANLEEVQAGLEQLRLRLEKLQFAFSEED